MRPGRAPRGSAGESLRIERDARLGGGDRDKCVLAADFFLLIGLARVRLAYAFGPHFAVSLSAVELLPRQLEATHKRSLPQTRLCFLLVSDRAENTIMAGLLIKGFKMREAISVWNSPPIGNERGFSGY